MFLLVIAFDLFTINFLKFAVLRFVTHEFFFRRFSIYHRSVITMDLIFNLLFGLGLKFGIVLACLCPWYIHKVELFFLCQDIRHSFVDIFNWNTFRAFAAYRSFSKIYFWYHCVISFNLYCQFLCYFFVVLTLNFAKHNTVW